MISKFRTEYPQNAVPFLNSQTAGMDKDYRTPLWGSSSRAEVSSQWLAILEADKMMESQLRTLELKQYEKIGPLSPRLPFPEREKDVQAYFESQDEGSKIEFLLLEKGDLDVIANKRLRPIDHISAAQGLSKNTSSGLPLMTKRNQSVEEHTGIAKSGELHASLLGWRGQSSGTPIPKQRVVWMYPYSLNILENRYFVPIFEQLRELDVFAAWNNSEDVDIKVTKLFAEHSSGIISTDFTKFDQSLTWHQDWIFDYLISKFQVSSKADLEQLRYIMRNIPMRATVDKVFTGKHGMPSGSVLTNLGDSIVNYLAQLNSPEVIDVGLIQGDDAVVVVRDVANHLQHMSSLGFEMNPDKQYVDDNAVMYLQKLHTRTHQVNGISVGVYPTMRALNSLLGQERFHSDWDTHMVTLRSVAILENCKFHPTFEKFVKFTVNGDPAMKANLQAILKDSAFIDRAKVIPGFFPTYNSDNNKGSVSQKGLYDFHSVKIIMDMNT